MRIVCNMQLLISRWRHTIIADVNQIAAVSRRRAKNLIGREIGRFNVDHWITGWSHPGFGHLEIKYRRL